MRDGKLSDEEKMPMRLMGESHVFLGAGTETAARSCYGVLSDEEE